ncbi:MAG: exo-alpha-sialidase [Rhodopirellula sp.]|nr:exo-alpha-sialidase [Rhodopirellula sp.]
MRCVAIRYVTAACSLSVLCATASFAEVPLPDVSKPGSGAVVSAELIYQLEGRQTPQCHASTIVETSTGLVAAWFGGTRESDPDVGIWVSRHEDGQWSKPVEVADGSEGEDKEYACWNPVLFQPKTGPLMLFYKVGVNPRLWWGALMTSTDSGRTWSKTRRLGTSAALPDDNHNLLGPVKNKPLQLKDGSILCPSSTENVGWRIHFELTRDLGKTWEVIGPIHDATTFNAIQPSILTHPNEHLQVLCRSQENVVVQSWSADNGRTWGPVTATELPNPNAGTDAVTLADGRHLIVYNHTVRRGPFPAGRSMLNVAISKDGKSWKPVLTLEKDKSEFSYPAIIQTSDGKVQITYTFKRESVKHVVIDPSQL